MYCDVNFRTKKQLKEAVADGREICIFSPGPFQVPRNGVVSVEGPHFPRPHSWYARVKIEGGIVKKVVS